MFVSSSKRRQYLQQNIKKMKSLFGIIAGAVILSSVTAFGQTDPSRNYKTPVQDRRVVKNQEVAINKKNVGFTSSFDSPQNYKHQVFNKNQESQDLLVLSNSTEKVQTGMNPLESNRNYKSPNFTKVIQKETNKGQLASVKE